MVGIETVEVLKGPRSALFGRGEPGGTVNLITKRPQFETGGDIRATFGEWGQTRLEADVQSTAGSDDSVGVRLVGFYEDAESFRETVETSKVGLYPSITRDISDATSLTYELELHRTGNSLRSGGGLLGQVWIHTPRNVCGRARRRAH